jgi:hypothetical protein
MDRARRAPAYHLFAAEPLVIPLAILPDDSPKLAKLIRFCLAAIADPTIVSQRTASYRKPSSRAVPIGWLYMHAVIPHQRSRSCCKRPIPNSIHHGGAVHLRKQPRLKGHHPLHGPAIMIFASKTTSVTSSH